MVQLDGDGRRTEEVRMETVTSGDGTRIAFDRLGDGPPVVLVCGQSTDRSSNAPLATLLAEHFAVFNYDRRGRGDSGDTLPYAVELEVEDLGAVFGVAGGSASVFGVSSGASLALEAAASGLAVDKLALWEPPFVVGGSPVPPTDLAKRYEEMLAEGRRSDVIEYFMADVVGLPPEFVAQARSGPYWQRQEVLAHTLVYDNILLGDGSVPVGRAAAVVAPTLVLAGGENFPFMRETARTLADAIPDARSRVLEGQTHAVAPEVLAPVLGEFFGDRA
jgi:pimeloyl-ACP methyl ester carboxylesterase